jgi:hypothetical protein
MVWLMPPFQLVTGNTDICLYNKEYPRHNRRFSVSNYLSYTFSAHIKTSSLQFVSRLHTTNGLISIFEFLQYIK